MKQIMIVAIGATVLYQVAKKNGIKSFSDLKEVALQFARKHDLERWLSLETWVEALNGLKSQTANV